MNSPTRRKNQELEIPLQAILKEAINTPTQEKHRNCNGKKSTIPNLTKGTADNAELKNRY